MFTFYELNLNEENQTQEQDTFNTDILYIYKALLALFYLGSI